jgi:hypothetical protein
LILPSAEGTLAFNMGADLHRFTSLYVQQFAAQGGGSAQPTQYDKYAIGEGDISNVWSALFAGTLADLQKVIEKTAATSPKYAGVAEIIKAYTYQVGTDVWGDLPFTDGVQFQTNLTPKYDASSVTYDKLIVLLDQGIADIKKPSALAPGADDLIYAGDMDKWERFANALKLRIYIHYFATTPADAAKGKAGITAVLAANKLMRPNTTANDNFQMRFLTSANQTNPIHQFESSRPNQFFPSKTLVDLMNAKSDSRRAAYFTQLSGAYVGAVNGNGDVVVSTSFSRMNTYIRGKVSGTSYTGEAPIRMMTYAEQELILAEYFARADGGNTLATAQTYFTEAIRESFAKAVEFSDATEAATVSGGYTAYQTANGTLVAGTAIRQIIEEKFVSNYGVTAEPWTDWRRTAFPALTPVSPATAIPRILPYSFTERSYNPNVPARPSVFTKTVFWDK